MAELITWPKWLGVPLEENYSVEVVDRRKTTEMEVGSVLRVEFDTDECVVSCNLLMNNLQANYFEKFERDKLNQGSKWFSFPLWIGGQLINHSVRFRERPQMVGKQGPFSEYSFTLDLAERLDFMPDWMGDLFEVFSPDFIIFVGNKLHFILHTILPKSSNVPDNIWTATVEDWEAVA